MRYIKSKIVVELMSLWSFESLEFFLGMNIILQKTSFDYSLV